MLILLLHACTSLPPGISSLIAQIPSINLFRSIGYFNAICDVFMIVLLFALFRGEYAVDLSNLKKAKQQIFGCKKVDTTDLKTTRIIVS